MLEEFTKNQLFKQLLDLEVLISDSSLRNYSRNGVAPEPRIVANERGKLAMYPKDTAAEVYAAYEMLNDKETPSTFDFLRQARKLGEQIEKTDYEYPLTAILDDSELLNTIDKRHKLVFYAFEWLALKHHSLRLLNINTELVERWGPLLDDARDIMLGISQKGTDYAIQWMTDGDLDRLDAEDWEFFAKRGIGEPGRQKCKADTES